MKTKNISFVYQVYSILQYWSFVWTNCVMNKFLDQKLKQEFSGRGGFKECGCLIKVHKGYFDKHQDIREALLNGVSIEMWIRFKRFYHDIF